MHFPHSMTEIAQATRHTLEPLIRTEHRVHDAFIHACHAVTEAGSDIKLAITTPDAMDSCDRRTDEMKVVLGFLCAAEPGFFPTVGGLAAAVEGLYHMEHAGHVYREQHPTPVPQAPASGSPRP